MKKNSYLYLVPMIFGTMLTISLLFAWRSHIYSVIFFKPNFQKIYITSSLILAAISSLGFIIFKKDILSGNLINTLKKITALPLALFLVCLLTLQIPLSLLIYLSDGTQSTYTTAYTQSPGGRNSCRGIEIFEPELNKAIKICHSSGDSNKGLVKIYKTSNTKGIVITGAAFY
ncbi:hypothetical protein HBO15_13315 [Pseudomonas sp. WS 5111]|uniref:hypothetical protein n=1 Tax=unclassified Pseudomonas TaxID=196821 RepID=UPI00147314CC|nr:MULTISPECIES: hypothetical protein [unclassified Pseudomonas]NMX68331.1 hypothetical protein [Pseudomonas sp. WS 5111]NMX84829.1 hypothetical protein [Pseudomonas sp. WS 5010]